MTGSITLPYQGPTLVVRSQLDQQDSQQDRDGQQQQNDRVFSPLSQDWRIPHSEAHQQEDHNCQQELQQAIPGYNSPALIINYDQQPSLGSANLSGPPGMSSFQPQLDALSVSHQQVSMSGTQQQPPPSGAPQTHYNQPSARRKEYSYNSDYY
ncbi:unnamed protein product [Mytilus coruscus]|uniref:Uncharacterized protein n=1 Tax=Mytilus coruscus TaxID=42192 RepID=A0A6J8B1G6_MYTCO|nr:unnamed protein product [Mytilus coruscus]